MLPHWPSICLTIDSLIVIFTLAQGSDPTRSVNVESIQLPKERNVCEGMLKLAAGSESWSRLVIEQELAFAKCCWRMFVSVALHGTAGDDLVRFLHSNNLLSAPINSSGNMPILRTHAHTGHKNARNALNAASRIKAMNSEASQVDLVNGINCKLCMINCKRPTRASAVVGSST